MNLAAVLERPKPMWQRRIVPSDDPRDPQPRLPLRVELFLIAHHDKTGKRHLSRRALTRGLASAVLLQFALTGQIQIGKHPNIQTAGYTEDTGRISLIDTTLYGDPIDDTAMKQLRSTGGTLRVHDFIRAFATPDLYDRIQGDMLATGVLKRETYYKWGFIRTERYVPTQDAYPIQARSKIRDLFNPRHPNDPGLQLPNLQTIALAGVTAALGLTRHLYHSEPGLLHRQLMNLIHRLHDNTVRDVTNAIH